ncbi:MAG: hypothetical protein JNL32_16295, partial [Candidatus Kapabacteria bacterium]|nr:hypothetical protein [Candidatus Kapabacteria bacterium]
SMNLTTFTLSVIVTLLCTLSAYAQRYTTTCLSGTHVRGLNLGGDTLVVFGSYGIIVRSDNGGDTWQQIPGISPAYYLNMPSFNGDTVVVTTDSSVVLVSMDRGRTWREQRFDSLPPLFLSITHRQGSEYLVVMGGAENYGSIYAIDIVTGASRKLWHNPTYSNGAVQQISDSLYCAAFSDGIYTSNDGGLTWIPSKSSVIINQFVPFHIKQLRNGTLAVCYQSLNAQFNRMAYSNDSGTTWAVTDLLPAGGSSWLNDSTVVFAGNFTEVYKVVHPLSSSPVITKLNFDVERMGWFSLSFTTIPLTTGEVIVTGTFRTLYRSDSNCTKLRLLSYMRTDNFVVDALDDDNIVSASTRQQFSVSSNGGSTWMPALLPNGLSYSVQSNAVRYFAKNFIVVNTAIQNLFVSTDGGQTYGLRPQNVALGDGGDRAIIASANRIYSTDH